jgi:hypothetical protein
MIGGLRGQRRPALSSTNSSAKWAVTSPASAKAKRDAARFVESLRAMTDPVNEQVRRIIVVFEEFCDLAKEIHGDYNDTSITY